MKKQNLIKKISVISSIITALSGNIFAMNTIQVHNFGNISSNRNIIDIHKNLIDEIVKGIADVFYPQRSQLVLKPGEFWNERAKVSELTTVMEVILSQKWIFNSDKLAIGLYDFKATRSNINHGWEFMNRDMQLLRLIADSFKGDSDFFFNSLVEAWYKFEPYKYKIYIK